MTPGPPPATARDPVDAARPSGLAWAWAMAQAGRDPYVIVISIYIFAPWFVAAVVGDPVAGQALVARGGKWGGWAVMLTMPVLGAMIDRMGPRKPLLAAVIAAMAGICWSLWWVVPPGHGLVGLGPAYVVAAGALMSWLIAAHEMLHNSLLVPAAGLGGAARASGLGLAGGNAVSVTLLLVLLLGFSLPGSVDWAWLPAAPLFGLDKALGEPARIAGPIVGVLMLLFSLPLFVAVPDWPRSRATLASALAGGVADLVRLFRQAAGNRNPLLYLLARMVFTDGLTAILLFGGILAAGAMGWGTLQMLGYGITLSCAAVLGGLLAGRLDLAIGPRPALMLELALLVGLQVLVLGCTRDMIWYRPMAPLHLWDGAIFSTAQDLAFLLTGIGVAITVTACYASSRTLLTRLVPPERLGTYFGLYALSGSATMWLGPALVELATARGGSQAAGFVPVIGLLVAGLVLLPFVKGGGRL